MAAGLHGLTVIQTDLAGNVSAASAPLLLDVDTVAPEPAPAPVLATASDSGTVGDGITDAATPVISGVAEAYATIRLLDTDGSTLLGTTTADGKGDWNITSAALTVGAHALTVTQTDTAGNLSGASAALDLTIVAAPPPTTPPTTPTTTVDGVPVTQQPVTLPGGGSGTQTTVPIVVAGRVETTGNAGTADIPLATAGAGTLLLAQVGAAIGTPGATLLHGGAAGDTAVFTGAQAAYTVDPHDGYVLVTGAGGAQAEVVNAETLQFADASIAVENRAELTTLAGLYADVLGRQADVAGFDYWGTVQKSGASLGEIALSITASAESGTLGRSLSGDAAHDIGVLYEAIFHRAQDAGGAAYWLDAMRNGVTLAQVADGFMHSTEIVGHAVAPTGWDFMV